MKIEKIVIVGGGSSGWMTASLIAKKLPHIDLTVIEPKDIPTIGVGESTLGHINRYMEHIGILGREKEWMPYCDATYKVSIQFTDFGKIGERFQYPFGQMDYGDEIHLQDWMQIKAKYPDFEIPYSNFYNPISYLADHNKMTFGSSVIRNYDFKFNTAYHFDSVKFGEWLKLNICVPAGVKVIKDHVTKITSNENGIEFLQLSESTKITADLFIDCTGFKSLLLEEEMGSEYIGFDDVLPNDSAIATKIPYKNKEKEITNVTDCHAVKYGWIWDIPLWSRKGKGFVYSSKYLSKEEAKKQFKNYLSEQYPDVDSLEFVDIKMRHGKRKYAWIKNVVGVGLSYGFLEPLESTGLFTTHENALTLVKTLERRSGFISKIDIDGYNYAVDHSIEWLKSFIQMHYILSMREDSVYWKDQIYNSSTSNIDFLHSTNINNVSKDVGGLNYISNGMGYHPIGNIETEFRLSDYEKERMEIIKNKSLQKDYQIKTRIKQMDSTYDFLLKNIYTQ